VIIDCHTHIFPPEVAERRADYAKRDPTFAEMYADPKAKIATAEELLTSMDDAGVDVSVALGFGWRDHDTIVRHNDYLLESAASSGGRILPFCTVNMANDGAMDEIVRCAAAGARGIGELRPESQRWELNGEAGERLAAAAREHGLILLFHVTEVGSHEYPGKEGLQLGTFYRFQMAHPDIRMIGGHLGGGLPMNAPTSQTAAIASHVWFDTAAQPYLYREDVYDGLLRGPFRETIVMGSDWPLISQKRQIEAIRRSVPEAEAEMVLGSNGEPLLGVRVGRRSG
jgi:predicted TIM-barrel fold metal-dependent hydrolase